MKIPAPKTCATLPPTGYVLSRTPSIAITIMNKSIRQNKEDALDNLIVCTRFANDGKAVSRARDKASSFHTTLFPEFTRMLE